MNMDVRQWRYAVTLGKVLNYTKAAHQLGVTQSALSRSIQALEEQLRLRLFDRDRGGVRLTEIGHLFITRATSLLQEAENLERLLMRTASAEIGNIRFGMTPLAARALLNGVAQNILNTRPGLRSRVTISTSDNLLQKVRDEEIDFCVSAEQHVYPEDMSAVMIGSFPISLMVRAGHPLLYRTTPLERDDFPFVTWTHFSPGRQMPAFFRPLFEKPPQIQVNDLNVLVSATINSDAVLLGSSFAALPEIQQGILRELRLPDGSRPGRFRMMMYNSARRSPSPGTLLIRRFMDEELRKLLSQDEQLSIPTFS